MILFLFIFAAERITGSQNRVLTQEIVRSRRQTIWWTALGLAIFGMCGELVVQTSFIAFKSNSKWHEEFMRVVGFVKLRTLMEYVMEFVPLFLVAISAAGKLHNESKLYLVEQKGRLERFHLYQYRLRRVKRQFRVLCLSATSQRLILRREITERTP